MGNKNAIGKRVSTEESVIAALKRMVNTDSKVFFILWKYAPQLLVDGENLKFDDLRNKYKCFESKTFTESYCNNWLGENKVQVAIKWLLERLDVQKRIELYHVFYNLAKNGDVQAFKAFSDFSKDFFAEKSEDEKIAYMNSINIDEENI